jgi:multiple sugar transport system ATP-binding protein
LTTVRLEGVTKRFRDVVALREVSIDVAEGEFFCVLGPPGAGKTTLLRTIVGLEQPDEGSVHIDGRDATSMPAGRRGVGIVFQNLALYPDKSVFDNLAFPLRQQRPKLSQDEIQRRVLDTAQILRIGPLLKRTPGRLSGGERQRVAIGRALASQPDVLLLDEPLSALDALLRLHMRAELKRLQRDLGRTLVYVTHDQIEALSMPDRLCVLRDGVVQQVAPPGEVYRRPANTFVAQTVGQPPMNLMPMTVDSEEGRLCLRSESFMVRAVAEGGLMGTALEMGTPATLGVRPEHVVLGEAAAGSSVLGRVIAVEPLGAEVIVDLDLDGRVVKAVVDDTMLRPNDSVPLAFDPAYLHVFDDAGASVHAADGQAALQSAEPAAAV